MMLMSWMLLACADHNDPGLTDSASGTDSVPAVDAGATVDTATDPEDTDSADDTAAPQPVAGEIGTLTADSQAADDLLYHPDGFLVASDLLGDSSLSNPTGTVLRRISLEGAVSVYAEGVDQPVGNTIDADGWIYAVEYGPSGRVYAVSPAGEVSTLAEGLSWASNLVAIDGALYVTTWGDDSLQRIDLSTKSMEVFATGGELDGQTLYIQELGGALRTVSITENP